MKELEAIFFDFGGTMVSEESDRVAHYHIADFVKKRYGIPLSHEEIDKFLTHDLLVEIENAEQKWPDVNGILKNSIEKLASKFGKTLSEEEKENFVKTYIDLHIKYMELFPDVLPALEKLRSEFKGHIGIISDIVTDLIYGVLKKFDLEKFFDSVTTSEEVGVGKPNPKIFRVAFEKAGVKGEKSIYVGNSPKHDVLGARRVGMKVILVGPEVHQLANFKVKNFSEILPIILDGRL